MQNPNIALPLVCNIHTLQLYFLKSFCSPVSLFHFFFMCFSSLLSWGITGCGGALQCGAEQGGGRGGEGESDIIGIELSLMLIPCTQTILWLFWLIPGPAPAVAATAAPQWLALAQISS